MNGIKSNSKMVWAVVVGVLILILISANTKSCSNDSDESESYTYHGNYTKSEEVTTKYYNNNTYTKSYTSFTNEYGTPTTICAHPGCNNYIAKSGDTNCCTLHSHTCAECGKYIDEDAIFCISCLSKAAKAVYEDKYGY